MKTDTYFNLVMDKYPKAIIEIYVKDKLVRSIPVDWDKKYEALNQLYKQYRESIKEK